MKTKTSTPQKSNTPRQNLQQRLVKWLVIVAIVLMIPFLGQWPWSWHDYVFGFTLLFGSAVIFEVATRNIVNARERIIVGAFVFLVLATVWGILATG